MLSAAYAATSVLCFVSLIFCIIIGSILLLYSSGNRAPLYLGLYYLLFGYTLSGSGLSYSGFILATPLFPAGNFSRLLCMPISWLYVRAAVIGKRFSWKDSYLALPALVYGVDYWLFRHPWLPPIAMFESLLAAGCWILQIRLLASARAAPFRRNRELLSWMIFLNALQVFLFLPAFLAWVSPTQTDPLLLTITKAIGALLTAVVLFLYPEILYTMKKPELVPAHRPRPPLDDTLIQRLTSQLDALMQEKKPFLDPHYSLRTLADTIGVPLYKLSAFLNQTTGTNFSDYLNQWRIRYCLDLIREKKIAHLNLGGIAMKCGFNNRNTFSTAFKKITGISPSAYLHSTR